MVAAGAGKRVISLAGAIDLDLEIGIGAVRFAEREDILAAAALAVAPDGIVRGRVGSFRNGERESRERLSDFDPLGLRRRLGAHRRPRLEGMRGGNGKHRDPA